MEERTYVDDIDRSIYDIRNEEKDAYRIEDGAEPGHCGADFHGKKATRCGWNCSACSPCRSITI